MCMPGCVLTHAPRFAVWEGGSCRQSLKIWMIRLWKRNFFPSSADGLPFACQRAMLGPSSVPGWLGPVRGLLGPGAAGAAYRGWCGRSEETGLTLLCSKHETK